ncbi:MAG: cobamide remodeling phosphodiesterase CbiR [Caldilineaceae bacterium]
MDQFHFRIGTTSYIVEADLIANAHFLADKVADMQLVLFDLPDGPSNIPTPETVAELAEISHSTGLTYSVHLIDDLLTADVTHPGLQRSKRLIELFAPLQPSAYVLHLDGRDLRKSAFLEDAVQVWQNERHLALEQLGQLVGDRKLLSVENLEGYPPELVTPVVEQARVSRCVDVGHLFLDGLDPLPHLRSALSRTRMVHLHGLKDGQDHQSLAHMPTEQLDSVIQLLLDSNYDGLLTLEIFGEADFTSSLEALMKSIKRVCSRNRCDNYS